LFIPSPPASWRLGALLSACFLYVLSAGAAQYEAGVLLLTPEDTFLGLNGTNHSTADTLNTYTWPDLQVANTILLKFDVSSIPTAAVIEEATLRLALTGSDRDRDRAYTITAHKLLGLAPDLAKATGLTADGKTPWTKSACCHGGVPLAQANLSHPYATSAIDHTPGFKTWDITAMAREWLQDPASNTGLVLNADATAARDRFRFFASTEHADPALRPQLRVRFSAPDATPPVVVVTSPLAGGDLSGRVRLAATAVDNVSVSAVQFLLNGAPLGGPIASSSAEMTWDTTTISDGAYTLSAVARDWAGLTAASAGVPVTVYNGVIRLTPSDTFLNVDGKNYSTAQMLSAYTWPDQRIANAIAMTFDLSAVPAGATITNAALHLALVESDGTSDGNYSVSAHRLTKRADVSTATGFRADDRTAWTPAACCANKASLAQADLSPAYDTPAVDKRPGFKTWNVTAIVQEWLADPSTNLGLLLNGDASRGRDRYRRFASVEHPNATLRPYLAVSYSRPSSDATYARVADGVVAGSTTYALTAVRDRTAPSITLTSPKAGTTVSGIVALSATATDNVGVVDVQFRVDGANFGAADRTAPYSVAWNTAAVPNGTHVVSARARDAAGNLRATVNVTVTVSNAPAGGEVGIAASYPGDTGIETNPDVVLVERFEDSLGAIFSRWTDIRNGAGMVASSDAPVGSPGSRSLNIPWVGGISTGGHLYKQLPTAVDDVLYVRYYIKYPTAGKYQHTGVWMGGNNPSIGWPEPKAGTKPTGSDRFIAGAEQNTQTGRFDHYNYWMNMRPSSDGKYWGNLLLNNAGVQAAGGQWTCVEHMVKLNNPVTESNGEHAIWLNGAKVSHLGKGFPAGTWSGGVFTQTPTGTPFEGLRWRSDANLKLNWIWLQNYSSADPAGFAADMLFDHLVVAKRRIGCLTPGAPAAPAVDTTAPAVAVVAPAAGSTVSGSTVSVTANASDNVAIAGVQFKLDGVNLGPEDTAAPYSAPWNTTLTSNGTHTLSAIARDAAGNTSAAANVSVTVSNGIPSAVSWPNEPLGFRAITDMAWNALTGNGWNYLRRSSAKDDDIVMDASAPLSAEQMLRIIFTPSMPRDTGPSVHWIGLPSRPREMFTGWWMKMSPNWSASPAGGGKITFAWAQNGQGQVYSNIGGSAAPHRININTEWAPYGQKFWEPNVTTTPVNYSQWYRIEWYLKWESTPGAGDGVMKWWVNGVLNGHYTNVYFPATGGFEQFEYAPTRQNSPLSEEYLYIDHTRVSAP
jgi:hypothetical protein